MSAACCHPSAPSPARQRCCPRADCRLHPSHPHTCCCRHLTCLLAPGPGSPAARMPSTRFRAPLLGPPAS
eukprot:1157510-Pelagomonas_calceolata.AAC.6